MAEFKSYEAPAREARSLPVMLPAKLVGRDTLLAQIHAQLQQNQPVLVYGVSGVGKTALAAALASAYSELPGGVLWLDVHQSPLEELLVRIGRAYDVAEIANSQNPMGMVGAVANTLTQHKPLIVLDGRHDPQTLLDFVRRCAAGLPVLILSDEPLDGDWITSRLDRLDEEPALELFQTVSGLPALDADAQKLVNMLGYIPFAITIAAGAIRVGKLTPAQFMSALPPTPPGTPVNPQLLALTAAYRALNTGLQGIILMMGGTFTGRASAELLSMISGAPADTLKQVMAILEQQYMVRRFERYGEAYYYLHDVTYAFAQTWLRGSGRLNDIQAKVKDATLTYAKKYATNDPRLHSKIAAEMDSLLAVANWSAEQGDREVANQLVAILMQAGDFVKERGFVYELLQLRDLSTSFKEAFPAYPVPQDDDEFPSALLADDDDDDLMYDDDGDEDDLEFDFDDQTDEDDFEFDFDDEDDLDEEISAARSLLDDADEATLPGVATEIQSPVVSEAARYRTELAQARQDDDKRRQVAILETMAESQIGQNMETEAINTYNEALTVYEELDDSDGSLKTLRRLAELAAKTENSQAAVMYARRGISLAQQQGDTAQYLQLLIALGDAHQQLGESQDAISDYEQALGLARSSSDKSNEALILYKLGYAQFDNGDSDAAAATWETALQLFREQGKRDYEGKVMGGLGSAYGELGRWSEAISLQTSALYIAREVKDKEEEALQLSNLGYASVQANQLGQAVLRYRQALHLAYQSGDRDDIVSTIVDLARLLVESPRHLDIAGLLLQDALRLEPHDRDVLKLQERIEAARNAPSAGPRAPVSGSAQDYAAKAYQLLDEGV
jgi:tetratricopeptide (TPR) repeat protein/energy-coupling factor transporter ATP-binding protein EcfA2